MKFIHLALLAALWMPATAQSSGDTRRLLRDGAKGALNTLVPPAAEEQREAFAASKALLDRHLTWHADGSAAADSRRPAPATRVEWKGLRFHRVMHAVVSEADRLNGVARRFDVFLTADAHRDWDNKANNWTAWRSGGYLWFPSIIRVEDRNGTLTATASHIESFSPTGATGQPHVPTNREPVPGMVRIGSGPAPIRQR